MKLHQLKEFVKQTIREEQDYQQLFKHMLDKTGKSIADMSDDDKKKFFNAVDTAYKAKSEGRLRGYNEAELTAGQKKIDVDKDGEIEGSDLAALRAGKTNEAKYPTSLYVNSIIYGQGFTGLKGIEGGKYYKVVEMDDTTATLAPCDQKGKITGSKKVRHKLSSLEGSIKTAKRGDENGIVIESVNEAGSPINFNWPKGNTSKEIEKLEAEYKALIEKGSDILEKQKQLIRNEPLTGKYPWENYDKWPTKLKVEVEKLNLELEKNFEKTNEMGKKLFKLKGFSK
jgi:uncharacterized membrane-anchored protein YhcB (DUF1043 family)